MKSLISAALAATLALGAAGAASAQPYGQDRYSNDRYSNDRNDNGRYSNDRHDNSRHNRDRYDRHDNNGWNSEWRRGGRIDHDHWRHAQRVDWRRHHLRQPPRGYEWREVDGRYVMAAIASGLIADLFLNGY